MSWQTKTKTFIHYGIILCVFLFVYDCLLLYMRELEYRRFDYTIVREEIVTEEPVECYTVERPPNTVEVYNLILKLANEYGVNPETALRIANCESGYKYAAKNPYSSATGVYQWLEGTWENIGSPGYRLDAEDNIRAFMTWYPENKSWWTCK